jgi:hypothetical protein
VIETVIINPGHSNGKLADYPIMKKRTIKKAIAINASRQKVWDVLLLDKYTRMWYSEFSEGSRVETN